MTITYIERKDLLKNSHNIVVATGKPVQKLNIQSIVDYLNELGKQGSRMIGWTPVHHELYFMFHNEPGPWEYKMESIHQLMQPVIDKYMHTPAAVIRPGMDAESVLNAETLFEQLNKYNKEGWIPCAEIYLYNEDYKMWTRKIDAKRVVEAATQMLTSVFKVEPVTVPAVVAVPVMTAPTPRKKGRPRRY